DILQGARDTEFGRIHRDIMNCAGKVPSVRKILDHRHGTEPEPMSRPLWIIVIVDVRGRRGGRNLDSSPGIIRSDAAGRSLRVLNVSVGIAPDAEHPVDILLPKSLGRVRDLGVWRGMVVGRSRHVIRDLVVVQDTAGSKLVREWVRTDVLEPVQDRLVVDRVIPRWISPVPAGVPELGVVGHTEVCAPPVLGSAWIGRPDEEALSPVPRSLRVALELRNWRAAVSRKRHGSVTIEGGPIGDKLDRLTIIPRWARFVTESRKVVVSTGK